MITNARRTKSKLVLLTIALAGVLGLSIPAQAFTVRGWKFPNESSNYFQESSYTGSGSGWASSGHTAFADWQNVAGFVFGSLFSSPNRVQAGPDCGSTCLAKTTISANGTTITKFVTVINKSRGFAFYDGTQSPTIPSNYYDLKTVMRHEIGHGIGICHTNVGSGYLMSTNILKGTVIGVNGDATAAENHIYNGSTTPGPTGSCIP